MTRQPAWFELTKSPEEAAYNERLCAWFVAEEAFLEYFEEIEEEAVFPDLYGKSILVGPRQYPSIHSTICDIAELLELDVPQCFIYETYSYVCDSEGLRRPRLELSARMVRDFSAEELRHVLAKEMYHLKAGHIRKQVMTEKMLGVIDVLPNLPGINLLKTFGSDTVAKTVALTFRSIAFNWYKYACFSAENFACALVGNIRASVMATLMTILNERGLSEKLNMRSYLDQILDIESCTGPMATLGVIDEALPYGPYRLLNMIRFYISDTGRELSRKLPN